MYLGKGYPLKFLIYAKKSFLEKFLDMSLIHTTSKMAVYHSMLLGIRSKNIIIFVEICKTCQLPTLLLAIKVPYERKKFLNYYTLMRA
jgi:hypothetical protein